MEEIIGIFEANFITVQKYHSAVFAAAFLFCELGHNNNYFATTINYLSI